MEPVRSFGTGLSAFAALAGLVGLVARLRAAAMPADEMFRSFPSEDGYLMLTVARSLALGHGLSTAAGTIPTNGVQPLVTFLQAAAFWLVGGERESGIRLLLVVHALLAAATAVLVYRLALSWLGREERGRRAALLGACAWFASPLILTHTMNMLETGLYTAVVIVVAVAFAGTHAGRPRPWPWSRCLAFGALLGAAFWPRNDAIFLMVAAGIAHLASVGEAAPARRRMAETLCMAAGAIATSLPWLVFNLLSFGSLIPVSGQAYLRAGPIGPRIGALVVALFEQLTLVASFEFNPVQQRGPFIAFCAVVVGLAGSVLAITAGRPGWRRRNRSALLVPLLFGAGLTLFYVVFFDAPYFVRRYLFPLSPFTAVVWGVVAERLWRGLAASWRRVPGLLLLFLMLANFFFRDRVTLPGPWRRGPLFRGVDWVGRHLPEDAWVGAFQSGTLGFFHDRTINLDGKVNPEALAALRVGRLEDYVVGSPIRFVVDTAEIVQPWARSDIVQRHFRWVVRDAGGNFAVLGRRGDPALPARPPPGGR